MISDLVNHKSSKFGKCRSILYGLEMGGIKATWLLPTKAHSSSGSAKPKEGLLSLCPMGPTILPPRFGYPPHHTHAGQRRAPASLWKGTARDALSICHGCTWRRLGYRSGPGRRKFNRHMRGFWGWDRRGSAQLLPAPPCLLVGLFIVFPGSCSLCGGQAYQQMGSLKVLEGH